MLDILFLRQFMFHYPYKKNWYTKYITMNDFVGKGAYWEKREQQQITLDDRWWLYFMN
jgi:hypothetical protein